MQCGVHHKLLQFSYYYLYSIADFDICVVLCVSIIDGIPKVSRRGRIMKVLPLKNVSSWQIIGILRKN